MTIDKLAWIYISDKRLLSSRSRGRKKYYIPGGKREAEESDEDALFREIFEECNVHLTRGSLNYFGTFHAQADSHAEGIVVQMTCYMAQYEGILSPGAEIEELVWLTFDDLSKVSRVDQEIMGVLYAQGLIL